MKAPALITTILICCNVFCRLYAQDTDTAYYIPGNNYNHTALSNYTRHDYDVAVAHLSMSADADPFEGNTWHYRHYSKFALHNDSVVIADCNNTLKQHPDNGEAFFYRGVAESHINQYQRAANDFAKVIELSPYGCYQAYCNLGLAKFKLNDWKDALWECNKALELNGGDTAWRCMGVLRAWMGDYIMAIECFNKAIAANPEYIDAYMRRARARYDLKEYGTAYLDFTRVIKMDSSYAEAYIERANLKEDIDEYKSAIEDCNKAIALNPFEPQAYINRGWEKHQLHDYKSALEDFNEALNLSPGFPLAYSCRAAAKDGLGDFAGAVQDCDISIALDSTLWYGYNNAGVALHGSGDRDAANKYMVKADEVKLMNPLVGYDATVAGNIAQAEYEMGDYNRSINDASLAITMNPSAGHAYNVRGLDKIKTGDKEGGCADLAKAMALGNTAAQGNINKYCK